MIFGLIPAPVHCPVPPVIFQVLQHYKMPYVDYRSLALQDEPRLWGPGGHHPRWSTHQQMADLIAFSWGHAWDMYASASASLPPHPSLTPPLGKLPPDKQFCVWPVSMYSAYRPQSAGGVPPRAKGNWTLSEDRPGKPGWITTQVGARLVFDLKMNASIPYAGHAVTVAYLRSYTSLGKAMVRCLPSGAAHHLEGLWRKEEYRRESVTEVFSIRPSIENIKTCNGLEIEFLGPVGSKFKVTAVASC